MSLQTDVQRDSLATELKHSGKQTSSAGRSRNQFCFLTASRRPRLWPEIVGVVNVAFLQCPISLPRLLRPRSNKAPVFTGYFLFLGLLAVKLEDAHVKIPGDQASPSTNNHESPSLKFNFRKLSSRKIAFSCYDVIGWLKLFVSTNGRNLPCAANLKTTLKHQDNSGTSPLCSKKLSTYWNITDYGMSVFYADVQH